MTSWNALDRELDAWQAAGRRATLWCRDDDACRDSAALRRLLDVAHVHEVPVALAVIPAALDASLGEVLSRCPEATIVQHGYAHRNHAPAEERRCELGGHRPLAACIAELRSGRDVLARAFGTRFVAVLVPPWNRIYPDVVAALPQAGFRGLSTYGPRAAAMPSAGIVQCNTHVDLVAWRSGRGFVGAAHALARLVDHLGARREAAVDAAEATGILSHHADLTDDAWAFLDELFQRTRAHRAVAWLGVEALFGGRGDRLISARSA